MTAGITQPGRHLQTANSMTTGDLADVAARLKRLEESNARHERQLYGIASEGFKGLLERMDALVAKVDVLIERVNGMDNGRKYIITLATIGVSSLPGIASLLGVIIVIIKLATGQPGGGP